LLSGSASCIGVSIAEGAIMVGAGVSPLRRS
jgi:hypothetical protein